LILFCICIYILLRRPQGLGNTVLFITAIALFTLSTVQVAINLVLGAVNLREIDIPYSRLQDASSIIYGITKWVASLSPWSPCLD
jgi:hypothetical protein